MKWQKLGLPLLTVGALLFIDAQFMARFVGSGILVFATSFEAFIFSLEVAKTAFFFAVKSLRKASVAVLVDIYGAELLLLPVLLVVNFYLHNGAIPGVVDQLVQGWLVGMAFGGLPFAGYRVGAGMADDAKLSTVLPAGMVSAELGVLLIDGAESAARENTGLIGVLNFALHGSGGASTIDPLVFAGTAAVYVSLLLYALLDPNSEPPVDPVKALALGAAATLLATGWSVALSSLSLALDLVFVPPTIGMAVASWWVARGK